MKLYYRMYHDKIHGYCAHLKRGKSGEWKQVSFWYTNPERLCRYWATKNGFVLDPTTNFFVSDKISPCKSGY